MKKQAQKTSQLEFLLLALVAQQPRSGYEIRRVLVSTPMAHFSDSPGSIYPALKRLQRRGLIRSEEETVGRRKRQRYSKTAAGVLVVKKWLRAPVTTSDVVYNIDELMLRFAFMNSLGTRRVSDFLSKLERHVQEHVIMLTTFLASVRAAMPITGRLALESGIESYESILRWARRAKKELASR
jgi:DNA-binding PadR family transcriptional regulator